MSCVAVWRRGRGRAGTKSRRKRNVGRSREADCETRARQDGRRRPDVDRRAEISRSRGDPLRGHRPALHLPPDQRALQSPGARARGARTAKRRRGRVSLQQSRRARRNLFRPGEARPRRHSAELPAGAGRNRRADAGDGRARHAVRDAIHALRRTGALDAAADQDLRRRRGEPAGLGARLRGAPRRRFVRGAGRRDRGARSLLFQPDVGHDRTAEILPAVAFQQLRDRPDVRRLRHDVAGRPDDGVPRLRARRLRLDCRRPGLRRSQRADGFPSGGDAETDRIRARDAHESGSDHGRDDARRSEPAEPQPRVPARARLRRRHVPRALARARRRRALPADLRILRDAGNGGADHQHARRPEGASRIRSARPCASPR